MGVQRGMKGPVHLKSTDGMETFTDSKRVVARSSEHFQKLLNVPGDIDHEALDNIPQRITKTSLDGIPTMDEMARAIAVLKDGNAPGGDGIPAEVWRRQSVQQTSPTNHQCLGGWYSLLSIAGKIFARILLNRLSTHITREAVPETQYGFRGNQSTVDMIFCL